MLKIKKILIAGLITLNCSYLLAQTNHTDTTLAGVYLTLADFQSGKLTYDIDCVNEKLKIKLHDFLTKSYIDVYYKGVKHTLQKNDVYGYQDCNSNIFRFFNNKEYQLMESGYINIYVMDELISVGRGFKSEKVHYFSSQPDSEIKPLTILNLKYAFPKNHKFHDDLDNMFNYEDVSVYDTFHKMYKVNHIYKMSL